MIKAPFVANDAHELGVPYLCSGRISVTEEEAMLLYGIAVSLRPRVIAEVGTGHRRSLKSFCDARRWMLANLMFECEVYTCDIDADLAEAAQREFPKAHTICGDASVMVESMTDAPGLVFIDGLHTLNAARSDFDELSKVSVDGCVFLFHDSILFTEIGELVTELGGIIIPTPRGIGIVRR